MRRRVTSYDELTKILQSKPYTTIPAISNVYEIARNKTKPRSRPIRWRCGIFTFFDASTTAVSSMVCIGVFRDSPWTAQKSVGTWIVIGERSFP